MKKISISKDIKISFLIAVIGLFSGVSLVLWQFNSPLFQNLPVEVSKEAIIIASSIQVMLVTFILSIIGIKLSKKVGFKLHTRFSKKDTIMMILISGLVSFIIIVMDKLVFNGYLGEYANIDFKLDIWELIASVLYGGVIEELMLRFFFVSLLVYVFEKVFIKKKSDLEIPSWIYISAIIIAALIFATAHLPATKDIFGLSLPIIIRCYLLNGLGGVVFGYFYWKKSYTMAVASHIFVHLFRLFLFMPLFY